MKVSWRDTPCLSSGTTGYADSPPGYVIQIGVKCHRLSNRQITVAKRLWPTNEVSSCDDAAEMRVFQRMRGLGWSDLERI